MKLKQRPSDFRVEELTATRAGSSGRFALYRLDKTGWTTPDALQVVTRSWNLSWQQIGYGGLKDRHAETTQFITIYNGPQRNFEEERLTLTYLGRVNEPFNSQQIQANRFTIVMRAIKPDELKWIQEDLEAVRQFGVPNYYDDQRFGSVTADGRFIGRELVAGRYEEGLKMALMEPYEFDRAEAKREKQTLAEHWGDWPTCKAKLPRGNTRSLVDYLVHHPTDFKGTIARTKQELQGLYLSAYQSELWNRSLARWITACVPAENLGSIHMHRGTLPAPNVAWFGGVLPLPCPRLKPEPNAEWLPHMEAVLAEEGLTYKKLKLPGLNKPYFSKGDRVVAIKPDTMTSEVGNDELNTNQTKLTLKFDLPRGAYATMVVKRITGRCG